MLPRFEKKPLKWLATKFGARTAKLRCVVPGSTPGLISDQLYNCIVIDFISLFSQVRYISGLPVLIISSLYCHNLILEPIC